MSPVQLYLRVRLPDGSYPYLKAAFAPNGRIRPHQALHNGKQTHFSGSTYYLRVQCNGKRVWEPAGDDPSLAVVNLQRKAHALEGTALVSRGRPPPSFLLRSTPSRSYLTFQLRHPQTNGFSPIASTSTSRRRPSTSLIERCTPTVSRSLPFVRA
jgi:hypothetical protein